MKIWQWIIGHRTTPAETGATPSVESSGPVKWLPRIDSDRCIGCERCVNACEHSCLEMVWSFATLTRPHDCGSEGVCAEVCPEQIIEMAWLPLPGDAPADSSLHAAGPH